MDTILVYVIVLAAALFLVRWFYRNLVSHGKQPGCDSCESCGPEETSETEKTTTASSPSRSS